MTKIVVLHPPVLPYGYTLHHRFQRVWEVAEFVRRHHPDLEVVDAGLLNMLQGDVLRAIGDADVLVLYLEPQMLDVTAALLTRARQMRPGLRVVAYGPAGVMYRDLVGSLPVDVVGVRGDLEQQVMEAIAFVVEGGDRPTAHVAVRQGSGWREPALRRAPVEPAEWAYPPLERMPIADIERIYGMKGQVPTMAVTVARGCPYGCSFCATPALEGRRDRRRPIPSLIDFLRGWPDVQQWQLYAPTFSVDRLWTLEFCEAVAAAELDISWRCTTRADCLDDEVISAMAGAGCAQVGVGVETLGPAQDLLRKKVSQDCTESVVRALVAAGIAVKAYVLMGLPRQTVADVERTIDFVRGLGAQARPTLYTPQGDVDRLVGMGLVPTVSATAQLDRKVFVPEGEDYGDYLRILYQS